MKDLKKLLDAKVKKTKRMLGVEKRAEAKRALKGLKRRFKA